MDIQTTKTLGGVGALLMLISPLLSAWGGLLGLVGIILVLFAMKGLADYYNESGIFNNALYGVLLTIAGVVIFAIAVFITLVDFLLDLGLTIADIVADPTAFASIDFAGMASFDTLAVHIGALFGSVFVLFIFLVISAIFYRKSLNLIQEKTGVGLFGTTGIILLIGAVLTIIFIGSILLWVSILLLAIAFFSIKPESTQQPPVPQT
jgi:uncharacterized membrane protein